MRPTHLSSNQTPPAGCVLPARLLRTDVSSTCDAMTPQVPARGQPSGRCGSSASPTNRGENACSGRCSSSAIRNPQLVGESLASRRGRADTRIASPEHCDKSIKPLLLNWCRSSEVSWTVSTTSNGAGTVRRSLAHSSGSVCLRGVEADRGATARPWPWSSLPALGRIQAQGFGGGGTTGVKVLQRPRDDRLGGVGARDLRGWRPHSPEMQTRADVRLLRTTGCDGARCAEPWGLLAWPFRSSR
jgi:hypothetical protein